MQRLKVAYNNIMRRLAYVPRWQSASHMFGSLGVRSYDETLRISSYSLMQRVDKSDNSFICTMQNSDVVLYSRQRQHWYSLLFIP